MKTRRQVIQHLKRLHKQGADLSPAARTAARDPVYNAARRLFGSYAQALVEADINPLVAYQRIPAYLDSMRLHHRGKRKLDPGSVAQRIKERRAELQINQAQAGRLCGLSESAIANYECGIRTPDTQALIKLHRGLGVQFQDVQGPTMSAGERLALLHEVFLRLRPEDQAELLNYATSLAGMRPADTPTTEPTL